MIKYYVIGVATFVGLLLVVWFIHTQREIGGETERKKQESENAEILNRAIKGARSWDACDDLGGLWDFGKSTCKSPTTQ